MTPKKKQKRIKTDKPKVSRVLNNIEPLAKATTTAIIDEVLKELREVGYKSLNQTEKARNQTDRNTKLLVKIDNFQNTLLEHDKEILSVLNRYKWQVRDFLETSSADIRILREEIQKIRTTQSHKGFNFFLLNASNIETGVRFIKRLLNFRNLFHRIFQTISRSANSTNQSITNSLDDVKGNGAFSGLNKVSETQPSLSPTGKIQNSNSNSIHNTQTTKPTNGGK